jgi:hypothetical protein
MSLKCRKNLILSNLAPGNSAWTGSTPLAKPLDRRLFRHLRVPYSPRSGIVYAVACMLCTLRLGTCFVIVLCMPSPNSRQRDKGDQTQRSRDWASRFGAALPTVPHSSNNAGALRLSGYDGRGTRITKLECTSTHPHNERSINGIHAEGPYVLASSVASCQEPELPLRDS